MGLCQEAPIPLFDPWVTAALGMAYALAGRGAAGLPLVERGVEQAVASGRRGWLVVVLSWLSEAYLLAGRLADELGMRPLQAHCHRGLGTLYATIGRRKQAHTELSTARALYRGMDMTCWLPQAEAALAMRDRRSKEPWPPLRKG